MIAPAPMAMMPNKTNGHARRHPMFKSFQGLPFVAKGRRLDPTTTGSNADVSVELSWFRIAPEGDPDLLVSELLVGSSRARSICAALQLSLVPSFRRADLRCSLTVLTESPVVLATSFARIGVSRSLRHSFSRGVSCSAVMNGRSRLERGSPPRVMGPVGSATGISSYSLRLLSWHPGNRCSSRASPNYQSVSDGGHGHAQPISRYEARRRAVKLIKTRDLRSQRRARHFRGFRL